MFYKMLDINGCSCHGGNYKWSLPEQGADGSWIPGAWTPKIKELIPCTQGWHLAKDSQALTWLSERIFIAEYSGKIIHNSDNVIVSQCRLLRELTAWNERTARLFAVWCARQALAVLGHPDPRSIAACDIAEQFANGQATTEQLLAACDAAYTAASDAGWDTARVAASDAASASAFDAVRDAVNASARAGTFTTYWMGAKNMQYMYFCNLIASENIQK